MRIYHLLKFILCLFICLVEKGYASVYYVSVQGTGSGTLEEPFASIKEFHDIAEAGDICFIHGGTYTPPGTILLTRSGAPNQPISLFAYPGETPIIDGRNADDEAALKLRNASWWHLKGLEVMGTQQEWVAGIRVNGTCSNLIFEQCNTHHCKFVGHSISGDVTDILVLNCDSHHNVDADYEDADGFQVYPSTHARIVYRGCRAWNNADDGWDFYFATAGSVKIENCWAFRNGYDDEWNSLGNGNGFKLGGPTSDARVDNSGGHTVTRCLAWSNSYCGFNENSDQGAAPDTLYHNPGYDNRGWTDFDFDAGVEHVLRNNVTYAGNGASTGPSVDEYNSWNLGLTLTDADFLDLDDTGLDGPRKKDGALPVSNFLKPNNPGSLIDAGMDMGMQYLGEGPDLGAYEYEPVTSLLIPVFHPDAAENKILPRDVKGRIVPVKAIKRNPILILEY